MTNGPVGSNDRSSASGITTPQATSADLDEIERVYAAYRKALTDVTAWPTAPMIRAPLEGRVWSLLPAFIALMRDGLHYRELTQHITDHMIASGYTYTRPDAPVAAEDGERE